MALLGLSAVFAVIGVFGRGDLPGEPWLLYALALGAGLCIVVSGVLDDVRSRIVAGWLGLGLVIAAVTWAVPGTLLTRAFFLACAGGFAIALAIALSRWKPHEAAR